MERKKIIKNTTGSPLIFEVVGVTIPASPGSVTIDPTNYARWAEAMSDTSAGGVYLQGKVASGDLVINDGGIDLNSTDGTNFLRHPDDAGNVRINADSTQNSIVGKTMQEFLNRWAGKNTSQKPTYNAGFDVIYVEYFTGPTQTTPNRIAKVDVTYNVSLDPTTEVWTFYKLDGLGTTVEKQVTFTHTFVGADLTKTEMVTA